MSPSLHEKIKNGKTEKEIRTAENRVMGDTTNTYLPSPTSNPAFPVLLLFQ
jgi:hypothetical protein